MSREATAARSTRPSVRRSREPRSPLRAARPAVESAPWLLSSTPPDREVAPEELFEKLQPFKELVAEDIRDGED
jgi:hypothetical protein